MSSGSAKEFEEFAQDCVRLAEQADTPELREKLLNLAREWMRAVMTTSPGPSPAVPRGAWGTMMAGGAPTTEKRRARVHAGDVFTHDHGDRGSGASAGGSDLRYAAVVAPKARANTGGSGSFHAQALSGGCQSGKAGRSRQGAGA